jgi:hypothetical protein
MKVITFSRFFPKGHPKEGQPTYFVEKIWAGLADATDRMQGNVDMDWHEYYNGVPKWHTIRAGNRWKVGDFFSPRFWSGKPYRSKQSLITEPLEIKKIWKFTKEPHKEHGFAIHINGSYVADWKFKTANIMLKDVAKNDGLSKEDFINWFPENFSGQIICWNEKINYYP